MRRREGINNEKPKRWRLVFFIRLFKNTERHREEEERASQNTDKRCIGSVLLLWSCMKFKGAMINNFHSL